jgi:radical SAM protein with 4Fe4S-binding SPASM domain
MLLNLLPNIIFQPASVRHLPVHLQVEPTNKCNLVCIMCPRDGLVQNSERMPLERFRFIYDQIKPRRINLSGLGEPLLNKDIFKMSSYAGNNGSVVNLPSNFTLAGNYLDRILGSGISQIKVSIDAANRGTYLKIRGVDKFDEIVDSIRTLNHLKSNAGMSKPAIRFNFAVQDENIDEVVDAIDLSHRIGVDTIYFQYLEFVGIERRKPKLVDRLNARTLKRNLTAAAAAASKRRIHTNLPVWLRDLHLYDNKMQSIDKFKRNHRKCYFPWFSTFIEVNGDVKPCPVMGWELNEGKMGNIFQEDFHAIWNNASYRQLRKDLKKGRRPFVPCETCIPQNIFNLGLIFWKLLPRK